MNKKKKVRGQIPLVAGYRGAVFRSHKSCERSIRLSQRISCLVIRSLKAQAQGRVLRRLAMYVRTCSSSEWTMVALESDVRFRTIASLIFAPMSLLSAARYRISHTCRLKDDYTDSTPWERSYTSPSPRLFTLRATSASMTLIRRWSSTPQASTKRISSTRSLKNISGSTLSLLRSWSMSAK